jgi:fermentation-respiration switch protein FrsA (DUF1100 family)
MHAAALALGKEQEPFQRAMQVATIMRPLLRVQASADARQRLEAVIKRKITDLTYSPWYRVELGYDPRPDLAKVKAPVLVMNGTKDMLVMASLNVPAIRHALAGNPHVTVATLKDLNHFFQHAETGSVQEMATTTEIMAPEALQVLGDWVVAQTRRP